MDEPLTKSEICSILLRMVTIKWETDYWVASENLVTTNFSKLTDKLQHIEKANAIGLSYKELKSKEKISVPQGLK